MVSFHFEKHFYNCVLQGVPRCDKISQVTKRRTTICQEFAQLQEKAQ